MVLKYIGYVESTFEISRASDDSDEDSVDHAVAQRQILMACLRRIWRPTRIRQKMLDHSQRG